MKILLPDRETIDLLHDAALSVGGKNGIHNEEALLGAIERPLTYTGYRHTYDVDTVCACLLDSLARNHGFKDGNKRTSLLTVAYTYSINDIIFIPSEQMNIDFDELVMWVVTKKPAMEDIEVKLKQLREKYQSKTKEKTKIYLAFLNYFSQKNYNSK